MVRVLFVCMGNICRSPSAEGAFLRLLEREGLLEAIHVDSAGTHGYHVGEQADRRSMQHALKRGIDIAPHRARRVSADDFEQYDYILAMDEENHALLLAQASREHHGKIQLLMTYAPHMGCEVVPDPYYGGADGFEHVLDLVEAAAEGLLAHIRQNHPLPSTAQ